jgi:hypothetical protein
MKASAGAMAATETAGTTAVNGPFVVIRSAREHTAAVLRAEYPPYGIPPRGQGWDKGAKAKLEARGVDTCRAEYFHAVKINKRLANSLSSKTI